MPNKNEKIYSEGKYDLLSMTLSTAGGALDISPYVVKCDIYESILSPSVVCEVLISDSTGMFSAFSFTEEELCISWTTHKEAPPKHFRFTIIEMNPVTRLPNDKGVTMVLTAVSEEVLISSTITDIPLLRQKIEADKVVKTMLEDVIETEKEVFIEKTKGLHTFAFVDMTPLEAIERARRKAVSTKHPASAYVFYENEFGFHFKTIEQIIEEGLDRIGDKYFMHSNLANLDPLGSKWRNIIGWKVIQKGNQSVAAKIGGYSNSAAQYDIINGQLEFYEKKSEEVDFVTMNEQSISSSTELTRKRSKNSGGSSLNYYNSDQEINQVSEKNNFLPYYLSHFLSVIAHMTIYGDSTITVGDVITSRIPQLNALETDNGYTEDDPMLTGNYLVCKVRHVLTFGDEPLYFQGLEVIKDGVGGKQATTMI